MDSMEVKVERYKQNGSSRAQKITYFWAIQVVFPLVWCNSHTVDSLTRVKSTQGMTLFQILPYTLYKIKLWIKLLNTNKLFIQLFHHITKLSEENYLQYLLLIYIYYTAEDRRMDG